eukprot:7741092-Alexandrium_andersonii.AAC.1
MAARVCSRRVAARVEIASGRDATADRGGKLPAEDRCLLGGLHKQLVRVPSPSRGTTVRWEDPRRLRRRSRGIV